MWMKANQPEVYDASRWFLMPKDFINFRLTGVPGSDPSEAAGTYLWDGQKGAYSAELADALSVDLAKFAPIRPSHEVIGKVTKPAAEQTGLVEGTAVVAGGGDFPVAMLGMGMVTAGNGADVTGSSCLFSMYSDRPVINPAIQNLRHVVDGWIPFTCLDCGGMSMKWCRDLMRSARGDDASYDQLIQMAERVDPGSEGMVFYPYMLGERRHDNTDAKGCFFGIGLQHKAGHFVRAVMEGVAYAAAKDAELFAHLGARLERVFCVGGGARNALWNQIKADVFGMPLALSDEPEAGLQGAALLGAAGVGLVDDLVAAARKRLVPKEIVQPNAEASRQYRSCLEEFTRIYDHQLGFWQGENVPPLPPPKREQTQRK
jgi:sugar (pentulose or hexulose) kinase